MNDKLVSVCLTAYNDENYIDECIQSILEQTYKNIELIICNDASTDSTLDKLNKYASDERVTILTNEVNSGVAYTRTRSIKEAKGDYIALMDSDDICLPNRIAEQVKALEENNANFSATAAVIVDSSGEKETGFWPIPKDIDECKALLSIKIPFAHPSICISRELLEYFTYDVNEVSEDYLLWTQIVNKVTYAPVHSPQIKVRINDGSVSKTNLDSLLKAAHRIRVNWIESEYFSLTDKEKNDLLCAFSQDDMRNVVSLESTANTLKRILSFHQSQLVSELYAEQFFWMSMRHTHLGIKTFSIFIKNYLKLRTKGDAKVLFKRSAIIFLLSMFKIKYGSDAFNMLKKLR